MWVAQCFLQNSKIMSRCRDIEKLRLFFEWHLKGYQNKHQFSKDIYPFSGTCKYYVPTRPPLRNSHSLTI